MIISLYITGIGRRIFLADIIEKSDVNKESEISGKTKRKISILKVTLGGFAGVMCIAAIIALLYFTGVINTAPSGFETRFSGSGIEITAYTGDDKNIEIPQTVNLRKVVSIDDKVFFDNDKIETVVCPEGLKKVGKKAFAECDNLKSVTFNSDYTYFEESTFENSSLKKAKLPKRLQKISKNMFKNCENLTDVSFPDDLKIIDDGAFMGCRSLDSMVIGQSVFKIGVDAFSNCNYKFRLSSVIGSETEKYALKNNIAYEPCTSHYDKYQKYSLIPGTNTFNTRNVSDNKNGVLSFIPDIGGYYRITLFNGEGVGFIINSAVKSVQKCSTIKNNKNDFIGKFEAGKEYYFQISSKDFTDYNIDVKRVSQKITSMYIIGEKCYLGERACRLNAGTDLKEDHSNSAAVVATVNSDITLTKVLDYYIEGDSHIWYKINANINGSGKKNLWFKEK